jgi:hypothetical protein
LFNRVGRAAVKKLAARLSRKGARSILSAYFFGFILWAFVVSRFPSEWIGFWVAVLIVASAALLLAVVLGGVGDGWDDKQVSQHSDHTER